MQVGCGLVQVYIYGLAQVYIYVGSCYCVQQECYLGPPVFHFMPEVIFIAKL